MRLGAEVPSNLQGEVTKNHRFNHRRVKPKSPCGRKMIITMKMTPSGMR